MESSEVSEIVWLVSMKETDWLEGADVRERWEGGELINGARQIKVAGEKYVRR